MSRRMMDYLPLNPALRYTPLPDTFRFTADMENIRANGAALIAHFAATKVTVPDVEAETVAALGYNPANTLWPIDTVAGLLNAWTAERTP